MGPSEIQAKWVRQRLRKIIYLSSINHEPSILTMRRDGQKRKIIRKMCILQQNNHSVQDKNSLVRHLYVTPGRLALNNSKDVASTADCGRAFQPLSAAGRKECLNTSLLQWGRMNLMLLPWVWTVTGIA